MQIINIDNQMSSVININIKDDTGNPIDVPDNTTRLSITGLPNLTI